MSVFVFPADLAGYVLAPLTVEPINDESAGQQRRTKDGVLRWAIQTLVTPPKTAEGFQPAPFVLKVAVASPKVPDFVAAQPSEFEDFRQFAYEFNGKTGISFSASGIRQPRAQAKDAA